MSYRKSIKRDQLEGDFESLLKELQPAKGLFEVAKAMFLDAWNIRLTQAELNARASQADLRAVEKKIEVLLERILEAENATVIRTYETKINELERKKIVLAEQAAAISKPQHTQEELFELAFRFLSKPWNIWEKGSLSVKRTVLRLAFQEPVLYCRENGVRTPKIAFPFKTLGMICAGKSEMAHRGEQRGFLELQLLISQISKNAHL
ncbi:MAG: hypothetical protein GYB53_19750 [Rhodobacteraceae bacterium]|nr:hypothetical protein [Paracoccaceae bacterium]MBR9820146.1 hypothetical protein [Paracoccaceae bacterium]